MEVKLEILLSQFIYRILEIKDKKEFPKNENLYPGLYIKDIAEQILKNNKKSDLNDFEKNFELIKKESLKLSMAIIKKDLKLLGISHDNFFSETDMVKKDLVSKAVKKLKDKNFVEEGFLQPPKGESSANWKKLKD